MQRMHLPVVTSSYSASNVFAAVRQLFCLTARTTRRFGYGLLGLAAHTLTITATPLGGGLSTSEQQELVNESRLVDTEIITSTNALSTTATTTPMDSVPRDTFNFTLLFR